MKIDGIIFLWLFLIAGGCSPTCTLEEAERMMGDYFKHELQLNENLPRLLGDEIDSSQAIGFASEYTIVSTFSAECGKCINVLKEAQLFYEKHKSLSNFGFLFIAEAPFPDLAQEAIEELDFQFPVYWQREYKEFARINGFDRSSSVYETMIVNKKGEVLLFCDVFYNELAEDFFVGIASHDCE